jgi:acetamidase/formamidase
MFAAVRALVDPTDSGDVKRVHALTGPTTVEQTDSGSQRRLRPS